MSPGRLLYVNTDEVRRSVSNIFHIMDEGLVPSGCAFGRMPLGCIAAGIRMSFRIRIYQSNNNAVRMAVFGFRDTGRDHVVDYTYESVFENELLRLATDGQRIQLVARMRGALS